MRDLSVGLLHIAPISVLSWYLSRRAGIAASLLSAVVWYGVNARFAPPHIGPVVLLWNAGVRFGFFVIRGEPPRRRLKRRTDPVPGRPAPLREQESA